MTDPTMTDPDDSGYPYAREIVFRTPDGEAHATEAAALAHSQQLSMHAPVGDFVKAYCAKHEFTERYGRQVQSAILAWEAARAGYLNGGSATVVL